MTRISIIIPVGPYHMETSQRAIDSALAQTVSADVVVVQDRDGCGASWARNRGLEHVTTDFVTFLDADDTLSPLFLERTLAVWRPGGYVYTDHYAGDKLVHAPNCAWVNKTWHVITTLLRTADARRVGGFDETLPAFEDTDFYLKLVTNGVCGKRLAEPLFHYGDGGQRSKAFIHTPAYDATMRLFTVKYGAKIMACGDCGDSPNIDLPPVGEPLPGDELALATWAGNRQERGRATGRLYPRIGWGRQAWVSPADIDAAPHLWRRVTESTLPIAQPQMRLPAEANVRVITPTPPDAFPQTFTPPVLDGAAGVAHALNAFQRANFPAPLVTPQVVEPVAAAPDVAKAVALYREASRSEA